MEKTDRAVPYVTGLWIADEVRPRFRAGERILARGEDGGDFAFASIVKVLDKTVYTVGMSNK